MSGGALDYASYNLDKIAQSILREGKTPQHKALAVHIMKVSKAVHDLEWMLSGDTSPGSETEAIEAVLHPGDVLAVLVEEGKATLLALSEELAKVGK